MLTGFLLRRYSLWAKTLIRKIDKIDVGLKELRQLMLEIHLFAFV